MKITGTNSYIQIETNNHTVRFCGERIVGGFVAYRNTFSLISGAKLDDNAIQEIVEAVINKTKSSHMIITFE